MSGNNEARDQRAAHRAGPPQRHNNENQENIPPNINNITVTEVSGDFTHSLTWMANKTTPTAYLDISGFDINGTLDGNVTGLPRPLDFQKFHVMNITLQIELALPQTEAQDGVHF